MEMKWAVKVRCEAMPQVVGSARGTGSSLAGDCAMGQLYQGALSCYTSAVLLIKGSQPPAAKLTGFQGLF